MSERITRVRLGEAVNEDRTDWNRLRRLTDEELDAAIAADPDTFAVEEMSPDQVRYQILGLGPDKWFWRLIDGTGHVLARSDRSFRTQEQARRAIAQVRAAFAKAQAA